MQFYGSSPCPTSLGLGLLHASRFPGSPIPKHSNQAKLFLSILSLLSSRHLSADLGWDFLFLWD